MTSLRLALFAAVLSAPTLAQAYVIEQDPTGTGVRWPEGKVSFTVDPSIADGKVNAEAVLAAATHAAMAWADAAGLSIDVVQGQAPAQVGYDADHPGANQNTITLADDDWDYDEGVVAVTLLTFDDSTHSLVDTDILLNGWQHCFAVLADDASPGSSLCDDVENALTHEMGHALGLAHNPNKLTATMYPSSQAGEISKRHLSSDDVEGIQALYPLGATAAGSAGGCGAAPGEADVSLVVLGLLVLVLGRRRRAAVAVGAVVVAAVVGSAGLAQAESREPELVAQGRVVSTTSAWDHGVIRTHVVLQVETCLQGHCAATVEYDAPGGRVGHIVQQVGEDLAPAQGERLQVSLVRSRRGVLHPNGFNGAQRRLTAARSLAK